MTRQEQWDHEAEQDSFAADFRVQEHREYDYKLKRETLELFKQWIDSQMGPDHITNKHIEQWLQNNS